MTIFTKVCLILIGLCILYAIGAFIFAQVKKIVLKIKSRKKKKEKVVDVKDLK